MPDQKKTISMVDPFEDEEDETPAGPDPFEDAEEGPKARQAPAASASRLIGSLGGGPATAGPATPPKAPRMVMESTPNARPGGAFEQTLKASDARERMRAQVPPGRKLWDEEQKRPNGGEEAWIPDAHVSELAARGVEVCLAVPRQVGGETREFDLWIVPEVDEESERDELSWKDLSTIANCLIAFPGAKVSTLHLAGKKKKSD